MDDQLITDRWAIYNADCMDVMAQFPTIRYTRRCTHHRLSAGCSPLPQQRARPVQRERLRRVLRALRVDIIAELSRHHHAGSHHCRPLHGRAHREQRHDAPTDFPGDIIRAHKTAGFGLHRPIPHMERPLGA